MLCMLKMCKGGERRISLRESMRGKEYNALNNIFIKGNLFKRINAMFQAMLIFLHRPRISLRESMQVVQVKDLESLGTVIRRISLRESMQVVQAFLVFFSRGNLFKRINAINKALNSINLNIESL